MDSLETRLEHLGWRLNDLFNYSFADAYGIEPDEVVERLNRRFGTNVFSDVGLWRLPAHLDINALEQCEAEVDALLQGVRQDPLYQEFLAAFRRNDQLEIGRLATSLFDLKPDRAPGELFHGVRVDLRQAASEYVDLVLRVWQEGIRSTPHGIHAAMDEFIRPVYSVWRKHETHGLLFLGFRPAEAGYAVFIPPYQTERLIYARTLTAPFTLYAKTPAHIERIRAIDGLPMDLYEQTETLDSVRRQAQALSAEVLAELDARKVAYVPYGPPGVAP